jgi:hypothetical protein
MKRARSFGMRRAWAVVAWVATLMLALIPLTSPSFAFAKPGETLRVEICTSHGTKTETVQLPGAPAQTPDCQKCPHCLAAAPPLAAAEPAPERVAFTYAAVAFAAVPLDLAPGARAPPRPPSQGPPRLNA